MLGQFVSPTNWYFRIIGNARVSNEIYVRVFLHNPFRRVPNYYIGRHHSIELFTTFCFVYFFIFTEFSKNQYILQWGTVTVTDEEQCRLPSIQLYPGLLCTKTDQRQSALSGDSGSPVVSTSPNGTFIQIGIISYSVFTLVDMPNRNLCSRVTYFYDWIKEKADL